MQNPPNYGGKKTCEAMKFFFYFADKIYSSKPVTQPSMHEETEESLSNKKKRGELLNDGYFKTNKRHCRRHFTNNEYKEGRYHLTSK